MREDPFKEIYAACNKGKNKWKYENLPCFPLLLDISLTSQCNMACRMCNTGLRNREVAKGKIPAPPKIFMEKFLFLKILGEIKDRKTPIRFIGWGENTLHPDFWWFVKKCNEFSIMAHLNTNGTVLRQMREKIDSVKLSLHANSKKVREGVDALITMNCYRSASITDKEAEKTGIDITKEPFILLDSAKQYRQFYKGMDAPRLPCCPEVYNKLLIHSDGDVSACCNDGEKQMLVGNLHNETLQEIWLGEKIERYRELIASEKHWGLPLCKDCYDLNAYSV